MNQKPNSIKTIMILSVASCICFALFFLIVPLIIAIVLLGVQYYLIKKNDEFFIEQFTNVKEEKQELILQLEQLNTETCQKEIEQLKSSITKKKQELEESTEKCNNTIKEKQDEIFSLNMKIQELNTKIQELNSEMDPASERVAVRIKKLKELYKSVKYSIDNYATMDIDECISESNHIDMVLDKYQNLYPQVELKLHNMDVKDLRKAFKENDKQITTVLDQYAGRYNTKANSAIYSLMVLALRAELQNILTSLKYDKLNTALDEIKGLCDKYLQIAAEGNQSIANTLKKFIGQIDYLFTNAAKIEYNYYVKKEKERQEQLALKEKMREEAVERKALEAEKKKIEAEESKFQTEIAKVKEQLENAAAEEMDLLNQRILELQSQLSDVLIKKEDITNLQNGKAGTVYVISNLGSFGDDVFKIGMTRRLDPQDRVNELGSASVPFKFDVHSFIFSEDAVSLENKIHEMLGEKRVNKVNLRKEFFRVSLDELEALVQNIEPTAEFNRTMIASEYRASINSDVSYSVDENTNVNFNDEDWELA